MGPQGRIGDSVARCPPQSGGFGALSLNSADDYPDYVIPLAKAVADGSVQRGIALCGSGVGASIAANKAPGVRAALINDVFSARQGVEDDDMNVLCLGGQVIGPALAMELIKVFLAARFSGAERHRRRIAKVAALENGSPSPTNGPSIDGICPTEPIRSPSVAE